MGKSDFSDQFLNLLGQQKSAEDLARQDFKEKVRSRELDCLQSVGIIEHKLSDLASKSLDVYDLLGQRLILARFSFKSEARARFGSEGVDTLVSLELRNGNSPVRISTLGKITKTVSSGWDLSYVILGEVEIVPNGGMDIFDHEQPIRDAASESYIKCLLGVAELASSDDKLIQCVMNLMNGKPIGNMFSYRVHNGRMEWC